jgi:cold shock CspA family protein
VRGLIEAFDDRRGDGAVRTDDGERLYFHCVNIADGSRSIASGTLVSVRRGVGHLGHDEALQIVKEQHGDEGNFDADH